MHRNLIPAALLVASGIFASAHAQPIREPARGELLYATHCIACHTTRMHWRDKTLATDWTSLRAEVRRWQKMSGLGWDDEDIAQVAQYLNALHYRFATPD